MPNRRLFDARWRHGLCLVAAALCVATLVEPLSAAPGWELTWADEFNGSALDQAKWTAETTNNPANNELQAYRPQQVSVSGGNLVITALNQPTGGKQYVSGRLHSDYTQRHGRWEIRADLPTSKGMWPAIWLLPNTSTYPWPSQGEIDIMENRGQQPNLMSAAFHYGTNPPFNHNYQFSELTMARFGQPVNFHSGFTPTPWSGTTRSCGTSLTTSTGTRSPTPKSEES